MTRLIVFGAGGRAGRTITIEALDRGIHVVAAIRAPGKTHHDIDPRATVVRADASNSDQVAHAAAGCDVAINATRSTGEIPVDHLIALNANLATGLVRAHVPCLVIVGGAGSLSLPDGTAFADHPEFPRQTLPRGIAHLHLRRHLERHGLPLDWQYLIPPPAFAPNGPRTGRAHVLQSEMTAPYTSGSMLSYADYAVAVVDEITRRPPRSGTYRVLGDSSS